MCFSMFSKRRRNSSRSASSSSSKTRSVPNFDAAGFSTAEFNPASTSSSSSTNNRHYKFSQSSTHSSHASSLASLKSSLASNVPQIYDISQIRSATNNFLLKPTHSSSSSTAWHTSLNSTPVVITQRKLRRPITRIEALRENLHRVCRSHHSALVRLHGAAAVVPGGSHIYLVYERVEGGGASLLSECLRRNPRNPSFTVLSNWLSRVQIATDLADALDYLHNSSGGFVHNHVKSSSIIVTEEPVLSAKLCHYGTAQLCGERVEGEEEEEVRRRSSSGISSRAVKVEGTRGYMSPEFVVTGVGTRKSDVYAFGVVLLELLSGEEPLKFVGGDGGAVFKRVSLVDSGREMVVGLRDGGGLRKWVDWRLKDSFPVEVVERMLKLGVECCEDDPDKRPDMGQVAGVVSRLYLDSKRWAESLDVPTNDFTVSYAPR